MIIKNQRVLAEDVKSEKIYENCTIVGGSIPDLYSATFIDCDIQSVEFSSLNLCLFRNSKISCSSFIDSRVYSAFVETDINGSDFSNANVSGSEFMRCKCNLNKLYCIDYDHICPMSIADLTRQSFS